MKSNEKTIATLIHLSTFSQYFFPLGNYIFPILLWSAKKNDSEFVDYNGKQAINFQLSMLVYTLALALIAVPIFIYTVYKTIGFERLDHGNFEIYDITTHNGIGLIVLGAIAVLVFCFMKIMEFFLIIYAAVKTSNGEKYNYPLSIPFFK